MGIPEGHLPEQQRTDAQQFLRDQVPPVASEVRGSQITNRAWKSSLAAERGNRAKPQPQKTNWEITDFVKVLHKANSC